MLLWLLGGMAAVVGLGVGLSLLSKRLIDPGPRDAHEQHLLEHIRRSRRVRLKARVRCATSKLLMRFKRR